MAASFEEAKGKFNLLFEKDDYVEDVANLESGPFSEKVLAKYDIRTEGDLKVDIPATKKARAEIIKS